MSITSDKKLNALLQEHKLHQRLIEFSCVLVCHEHLGRLTQLSEPCDCGRSTCQYPQADATWELELGYMDGIRVNTIGLQHEKGNFNRLQFLRRMMHDLESTMKPRSFELVTLHFMHNEKIETAAEGIHAERTAVPPVDERWVRTLEFFAALCEDKQASQVNDRP